MLRAPRMLVATAAMLESETATLLVHAHAARDKRGR
jgi:hypothetical protein